MTLFTAPRADQASIETRYSWVVATVALITLAFSFDGLCMGVLGNAGLNAPLYIYVSRWFDRRRGSALALISSGSYIAGAVWPTIFERAIAAYGWRNCMLAYAVVEIAVVVPLAAFFFRAPPEAVTALARSGSPHKAAGLGLRPHTLFAVACAPSF